MPVPVTGTGGFWKVPVIGTGDQFVEVVTGTGDFEMVPVTGTGGHILNRYRHRRFGVWFTFIKGLSSYY